MKNEAQFKSAFKKSIKQVGGFSLSLSAPMVVGIPDLYVIMPGYMPVLLEAKWLGEVTARNFNRKIPYSAMQKVWMNAACDVQEYAALGLVGFKYSGKTWAVLCEDVMQSINYAFEQYQPNCTYDKGFPVLDLFQQSRIPKMPLTSSRLCANENGLPSLRTGTGNDN